MCVPFREWLFPGKLLEINLPSSASAADMSLVAGRTIAHNIKIIFSFLGVVSVAAYDLASERINELMADWKFTEQLKNQSETAAEQPKDSLPEIQVVAESKSEVCLQCNIHTQHTCIL